ncbi:MAG: exosortase/archaeosortase family protein [Kiritimatiellia bacterium]|jgi:exosortase
MQQDEASTLKGFRPDPWRWVAFVAATIAAVWLYVAFGSDSDVANEPSSIFGWVAIQWRHENFRHNWVMLLFSAYVIHRNRMELAKAPVRPSWLGLGVVALSLAAHVLGYRAQLPRLSLGSSVGVFWGIAYAIWGWEVAKLLLFPAAYAFLCFCGWLLMEVTMPLRLMASSLACTFLHGVGIEAVRHGTVVYSAAGGGFQFDVADACSGLRSLIVMTALAAPYAYLTLTGFWRQTTLFVLSVPLAMLANALRIFSLGVVAEWIGMDLAMTLYHDLSGILVFVLSLLLLMGTGALLEIDWRAKLCALASSKQSRA